MESRKMIPSSITGSGYIGGMLPWGEIRNSAGDNRRAQE